MKKVNILTSWFDTPNGRAFLFPLVKYRNELRKRDIHIEFFKNKSLVSDADVIIADSKYFSKQWQYHTDQVIADFLKFKQQASRVLFFDINDSSGWPHARILPYVDGYVKNQLMRDKLLYLQPLYGHRLYTDYYARYNNVLDAEPNYSEAVTEQKLLEKLKVGWNSGLADYSWLGPYRMALYNKLSYSFFLNFPKKYYAPSDKRMHAFSCRMGTHYARATVSWQRQQIQEKLKQYLPTKKIPRRKYYQELMESKLVISPFGLGEITLKDFEVFLTGGLLLKPDLSHMVTWPNWYQENKTFIAYQWDLTDLESIIENILNNYQQYIDVARAGQENYRYYLTGEQAAELFCNHFMEIIK